MPRLPATSGASRCVPLPPGVPAFGVIAFLIACSVVRWALASLARKLASPARKQAHIRLPLIGDLDLAEFGHVAPNGQAAQNAAGPPAPVRSKGLTAVLTITPLTWTYLVAGAGFEPATSGS